MADVMSKGFIILIKHPLWLLIIMVASDKYAHPQQMRQFLIPELIRQHSPVNGNGAIMFILNSLQSDMILL